MAGGPPPIYVGFGSVVVDDLVAMTSKEIQRPTGAFLNTNVQDTIIEATRQAGVRALVSIGWARDLCFILRVLLIMLP